MRRQSQKFEWFQHVDHYGHWQKVRESYSVGVLIEIILIAAVLLVLMLVIALCSPRSLGFRRFTGGIFLIMALTLVAYPLWVTIYHLASDDGLRGAVPSKFAFSLHCSLSKRLPGYIDARIASKVASTLNVSQITATESPVYGAFFYLQATERLQAQWRADPSLSHEAPAKTGAAAIEASLRIMLDEDHAHWMRKYWGDDILTTPNCFYRMLMIGCITSHHNLTGSRAHLALLKTVTNDLAADIDASPKGVIDDYPNQCFPCDIACALAMIEKAAPVYGHDRRAWAAKAFERMMESFPGGLPPYMALQSDGSATAPSRGCTNGFFFTYSRQLSPEMSPVWYEEYVSKFWQETALAAGWREFSNQENNPSTYFDPDSGPVIGGFGTGATGLGLGCTRVHGDHRRAGILAAEMIAAAVPLPTGRLLLPILVSDRQHAPYFAEQVILHQLAMIPADSSSAYLRAPLPMAVWLILAFESLVLLGLLILCKRLIFRGKEAQPSFKVAE